MKAYFLLISLFFVPQPLAVAQLSGVDSLKYELTIAKDDTSRLRLYRTLVGFYMFSKPDSSLFYGYEGIVIAKKLNFREDEANIMGNMITAHNGLGNNSKAIQLTLQATKIAEENNLLSEKAKLLMQLGIIYQESKNFVKALNLLKESNRLYDSLEHIGFTLVSKKYIGETFLLMDQEDSALVYCQQAYESAAKINLWWVSNRVALALGGVQQKLGNYQLALYYYREALPNALTNQFNFDTNFAIAQLYHRDEIPDSSIYYAKKSLLIAREGGIYSSIIDASLLLSSIYEDKDSQKALEYSKFAVAYRDSLDNLRLTTALDAFVDFDEQERQYEIDTAKTEFRNRLRMNTFLGSTFTLIVIAIFLFRNNRQKQKSKQKIEKAYDQLKATQTQLIQSEKMASLGELTAGIAHEIQNPLNFVNNFSEVSNELISELKGERLKVKVGRDEDLEDEIIKDVGQNLQKIKNHGQRASEIIKSMLQHSRTNAGERELTDINVLADEYLRLAYHGFRAKDKSFNAEYDLDLDKKLPKIKVIPQDIGRVLLNLINNAFYAVSQKAKENIDGYMPKVEVNTKSYDDRIEIKVKDNGNGILDKVKDKIFQPFYTTKPTGQGTGLGLSLSYDIIKAHGGEIKVEAKVAKDSHDNSSTETGTQFIIEIPIAT
jgi:signal transduction histidine kinase